MAAEDGGRSKFDRRRGVRKDQSTPDDLGWSRDRRTAANPTRSHDCRPFGWGQKRLLACSLLFFHRGVALDRWSSTCFQSHRPATGRPGFSICPHPPPRNQCRGRADHADGPGIRPHLRHRAMHEGVDPTPLIAARPMRMDHVGGLPYWFSQRHFQKLEGGRVVDRTDARLVGGRRGQKTPFQVEGIEPGGEIEIRKEVVLRAVQTTPARASDTRSSRSTEVEGGVSGSSPVELRKIRASGRRSRSRPRSRSSRTPATPIAVTSGMRRVPEGEGDGERVHLPRSRSPGPGAHRSPPSSTTCVNCSTSPRPRTSSSSFRPHPDLGCTESDRGARATPRDGST